MATVLILNGPDKGRKFKLPQNTEVILGRSPKCEITLADDSASRLHCQIAFADGEFAAADLNSSNGSSVNGQKITQPAVLKHGDVLQIGETKLRYEAAEAAKPAQPATGATQSDWDPFIGKTYGGYKVTEKIDEGQFTIQYRAVHELTEKTVRLKILQPMLVHRDEIVQRFIRQAKAGAEFNHPNVVQTLGAAKQVETFYIITEDFDGKTLSQLIEEQGEDGQLDPALTLDIMLQIGRALEHAYKLQIVHRDIKPSNIIVTKDRIAKLDNLWLAKHVEGTAAEPALTGAGKALGTWCYMPPEQIDDARSVDCRGDIYSLAATIYRALTGQVPCKGNTLKETIAKVRHEVPKPVREFNKNIPPAVALPVQRALSKDPAQRQQTPRDLVLELELARKYQVR